MKECIIFDVDGTLWDSCENILLAQNEVIYKELGIKNYLSMELLQSVMGMEIMEIVDVFFPQLEKEKAIELTLKAMAYETEYLSIHGGKLYDGVVETLEELSKKYSLMLVTNANHEYVHALFNAHGLGKYFIDFETNGNTGLSKDKNIRLIMERNGYEHAVYVGDTMKDQLACDLAEIPMVFASYGFGHVEKPWKKIDSFKELLEIF